MSDEVLRLTVQRPFMRYFLSEERCIARHAYDVPSLDFTDHILSLPVDEFRRAATAASKSGSYTDTVLVEAEGECYEIIVSINYYMKKSTDSSFHQNVVAVNNVYELKT